MTDIVRGLRRAWSRAGFYLNLPEIRRIFQFRKRRRAFWSTYWKGAASKVGAKFSSLQNGYMRLDRNDLTVIVRDGEVPLDSHLMLEMMGNKSLCNNLLTEMGAPVVPLSVFTLETMDVAEQFFSDQSGPVVVKPSSGTGGGRGVTTGIRTSGALHTAARYAARYDDQLIVEREITGRSYRLLYLGGEFVDAILREPPVVVGDGEHNIGQLVRTENAKRLNDEGFSALSPLQMTPDFHNTLLAKGLSRRTVPLRGQSIQVKGAINENNAQRNHAVRTKVHADTIKLCSDIVRGLGVEFAGVDILCTDISVPLAEQEGYVAEINTTPGLHHHTLIAADEEPTEVDVILLEYLFNQGQGALRLKPTTRTGSDHSGRADTSRHQVQLKAVL